MDNLKLKEQIYLLKKVRSIIARLGPVFPDKHGSEVVAKEVDLFLKRQIMDRVFISNAINLSYSSHCVSRQVGCVIALDGRTLVTGVNGTSQGDTNCDELFPQEGFDPVAHRKWSDDNEIHAELNAINLAAKHGISLDGSTLYCSLQPCMQCSKNLPAVGIERIVFNTMYDRVENYDDQREYLSRKGVIIERLIDDLTLENYLNSFLSLETI